MQTNKLVEEVKVAPSTSETSSLRAGVLEISKNVEKLYDYIGALGEKIKDIRREQERPIEEVSDVENHRRSTLGNDLACINTDFEKQLEVLSQLINDIDL